MVRLRRRLDEERAAIEEIVDDRLRSVLRDELERFRAEALPGPAEDAGSRERDARSQTAPRELQTSRPIALETQELQTLLAAVRDAGRPMAPQTSPASGQPGGPGGQSVPPGGGPPGPAPGDQGGLAFAPWQPGQGGAGPMMPSGQQGGPGGTGGGMAGQGGGGQSQFGLSTAQAEWEVSQELAANLQKLKAVIRETQDIARKIEVMLGTDPQAQAGGQQGRGRGRNQN